MPLVRAVVVAAALLAGAGTARAEQPRERGAEPLPYRAGVLLGDVLAATLVAGGSAIFVAYLDCDCEEFTSPAIIMLGLGGYLTWSPMVHYEYGHPGRAWLTVALRILLPAATGLLGHALGAETAGMVWSTASGALLAMIVDVTLLARPDASRPRQ